MNKRMKSVYLELSDEDLDELLREYFIDRGFEYGGSQREKLCIPPLQVRLYVKDLGGLRNE